MYCNRTQNSYLTTGISYARQYTTNLRGDSTKTKIVSLPSPHAQAEEMIRGLYIILTEFFKRLLFIIWD